MSETDALVVKNIALRAMIQVRCGRLDLTRTIRRIVDIAVEDNHPPTLSIDKTEKRG
jgi:hypothetical protein